MPRTSALRSHPPYRHTTVAAVAQPFIPPPPDRRPPERPPRPRRASVPSALLNREDVEAVEAALSDPALLEKQEQNLEARNIGFAVTNGSNPKRRSRSVGAFPSDDHRMSPIQWHHIRRRSDEIRYWRESTPLAFVDVKNDTGPDAASPQPDNAEEMGTADEQPDEAPEVGTHNQHFNFGLPADAMDIQNQERIGLEERLVTLELKLMDFEYTLSRIQAGSTLVSRRNSRADNPKHQNPPDTYPTSDVPPTRSDDTSGSPPEAERREVSESPDPRSPKPRPISIATTLKPGAHQGTYTSSAKLPTSERNTRMSLTNPSIEHYATLIHLIRHEQSARQRLEEQVTQLQAQIERLTSSQRGQQHSRHPSSSQHSYSISQSSQQRRQGMAESSDHRRRGGGSGTGPYLQQRARSSTYSTDRTSTDDEAYHDAYVTPNITPMEYHGERGEYERGAFERINVEEGVAF